MKGFVFRRNDPAVFGAEILVGKLRQKINVINEDGAKIGTIHQIQDKGKNLDEADKGNAGCAFDSRTYHRKTDKRR